MQRMQKCKESIERKECENAKIAKNTRIAKIPIVTRML